MVLDQSNWQLAEGLLPPEILEHYKTGGYANPIVDWPAGPVQLAARFQSVDGEERRTVQDQRPGHRSSSTRPVSSRPTSSAIRFPIIDPADPQAGAKILWNFFYLTWFYGNLHAAVAGQLGQPARHGAAQRPGRELHVLRRGASARSLPEPAELQSPSSSSSPSRPPISPAPPRSPGATATRPSATLPGRSSPPCAACAPSARPTAPTASSAPT